MQEDVRQRLRGNLSEVLARQVQELAELARNAATDMAVADALWFELDRLRATAASLGAPEVERAALVALETCRLGRPEEAIATFARACHAMDGRSGLFDPLVLVGVVLPPAHPYTWIVRSVPDDQLAIPWADSAAAFVVRDDLLPTVVAAVRARDPAVPIYGVGPRHDLGKRLAAAALGVAGYLSEPLDLAALLSRVRAREDGIDPLPFRVLLVESDAAVARVLRQTLSAPGVLVHRVANGEELLPALDGFWPELLLMSVATGGVAATALISVVRGHLPFSDLPILMLVGGHDPDDELFQARADEVLYTPGLTRAALISRVRIWIERIRSSRLGHERDLATGCLSRGAWLRAVERETGLARRTGTPLSLTFLDVDQLRSVNASVGSATGDQVLRVLAEILGGTLRATDLVGRVGADSYALLMPGCTARDAERRVGVARARFEAWAQGMGLPNLNFSAGVADSVPGVQDLLTRADRALGLARKAGGGRTTVAA